MIKIEEKSGLVNMDLIRIQNKNSECVFKIDVVGNIYLGKDQVKLEDERELALGFCLLISDLTGISFGGDKDEFIGNMVKYYRERQLNKIL